MTIAPQILVIDDETIVHESCSRILTEEGYSIDSAYTGQEGFSKIEEGAYDLVITDLKMPGISGMEALKKIKDDKEKIERKIEDSGQPGEREDRDFRKQQLKVDNVVLTAHMALSSR